MNLPLRWDAGWYLDIAVHGYRWSPAAEGQQNVAFFPAYPALMSLGAALVNAGNEPEGLGVRLSYERYFVWHLAAGLVVALAAFLWGLAYVYRLAREDLDDRSATSAVLLLCASGGCGAARRTGRVLVVPAGPHRQSARLARRPRRLGALHQRHGHAARLPPGVPVR